VKHCGKEYDFNDLINCLKGVNFRKWKKNLLPPKTLENCRILLQSKTKIERQSMPYLKDLVKITAERGNAILFYSTEHEGAV